MKTLCIIPARAGSKRVPGKNTKLLAGHPLIAYTIAVCLEADVYDRVIVSTDSEETAEIARSYGADVPFLRPAEFAMDTSPDIEYVRHALNDGLTRYDWFSIMRPTAPFRTTEAIQSMARRWELESHGADCLRTVHVSREHPAKMYSVMAIYLNPLLPFSDGKSPWHSHQHSMLPIIYTQNPLFEIGWAKNISLGNVSGDRIVGVGTTGGYLDFDIDTQDDWDYAEYLIETGRAKLPKVEKVPA